LIFMICVPIIGYTSSVAGIRPLTGGIIATVVTSEGLQAQGFTHLVTITALIMGLQNIIGMPLAINLLRRYGIKIQAQIHRGTFKASNEVVSQDKHQGQRKSLLLKRMQTQIILLFQIFLGGALAIFLDNLTGLNYSIWALAVVIVRPYIVFYQGQYIERVHSCGISMASIIIVIMTLLEDKGLGLLKTYLPHELLILMVGIIGIVIGGYITSKLFTWG